jgi:hypothetical protein
LISSPTAMSLMQERGARLDLKTRLSLSVALIAVLFVFWLFQTRPSCGDGYAAALDRHLKWNCEFR